jgi:Tol biopolymer transport system component
MANTLSLHDALPICLDVATGKVTALLDDPKGNVRDPTVHYDGKRILFSYRKGGAKHYHLYEIGVDPNGAGGSGLRQLTDGEFDDIEPTYLPDGGIMFPSTRCNRFVACWYTPVALLHRADADGRNIQALTCNVVHDNTPAVLPDGRILYTRWEYVDRSRVHFHHLWVMNPDGTSQMTIYGNSNPGDVYLDAKPVPGSNQIVMINSPNHGKDRPGQNVGISAGSVEWCDSETRAKQSLGSSADDHLYQKDGLPPDYETFIIQ